MKKTKTILKAFKEWSVETFTNKDEIKILNRKQKNMGKVSFYAGARWMENKAGQKAEREKQESFEMFIREDLTPIQGLKITLIGNPVKEPTHEEIMTLWWNMPTGKQYWQVESYNLDRGYWIGSAWQNKNWFIGRESYIIPPEK